MLDLVMTIQFRKDLKRINKRGKDLSLLKDVLQTLREEQALEEKYHDHALTGNYIGFRECHIQPDWLLVYTINKEELIVLTLGESWNQFPWHTKSMRCLIIFLLLCLKTTYFGALCAVSEFARHLLSFTETA